MSEKVRVPVPVRVISERDGIQLGLFKPKKDVKNSLRIYLGSESKNV